VDFGSPSSIDATCYSKETYPNMTADEICEEVANKEAHILCASKRNCGECAGTSILSGTTTCQWFDGEQGGAQSYCASGCGVDGCGITSCDAATTDENDDENDGEEDNNNGDGGSEQTTPPPPTSSADAAKRTSLFMRDIIMATLIAVVAKWKICL
jgi:hypothetical protein